MAEHNLPDQVKEILKIKNQERESATASVKRAEAEFNQYAKTVLSLVGISEKDQAKAIFDMKKGVVRTEDSKEDKPKKEGEKNGASN